MKLALCHRCGDIFLLRLNKWRSCECGEVWGRYVDQMQAEVTGNAISLAIGNGSLQRAVWKGSQDIGGDRESYIDHGRISHAWVRPNEGPGNPHTRVVDKPESAVADLAVAVGE